LLLAELDNGRDEGREKVGKRKGQNKTLVVIIRHIPAADAEGRLSRALDILLREAAKKVSPCEVSMPCSKYRDEELNFAKSNYGRKQAAMKNDPSRKMCGHG